jgi:hypothetical protein
MASMCEDCKCSTYYDEEKDSYHCENECVCCNGSNILEVLQARNVEALALTEAVREALEEAEDMGESNPFIFAESAPNRFRMMSLFLEDVSGGNNDGVKITEDVESGEIEIEYFTDIDQVPLTEGAVYDWALNFYKNNY